MKKHFTILIFFLSLLTACTSEEQPKRPEECLKNRPTSVAGLKVTGARSEKNVIHNMWPIVCKARELYQERLKVRPGLKGTLELRLSVEFNGEIGPYSIARSSIEDEVLERQILSLIDFMDFDPYGSQNTESDILFPIHLEP
ncbi:MAG TPA: hypothetical protein EYP19_08480 [Desulfobacterales bacterium]|nr:hypothetical protein [Desulfobacterales bacterium]